MSRRRGEGEKGRRGADTSTPQYLNTSTPKAQRPTADTQHPTPDPLDLVQNGFAVAWIVIIGAQYALVLRVPGAPDVSDSYLLLPLLAGVLVTGIMSYLRGRRNPS
jgi:hypothetical protein